MLACQNSCSIFQPNWKTGAAITSIALIAITLLALGVLGRYELVASLKSTSSAFIAGGSITGGLSLAWVIGLCVGINARSFSNGLDRETERHFNIAVSDIPYHPSLFGLNCKRGKGFPFIKRDKRQEVIDQTKEILVRDKNDLAGMVRELSGAFNYTELPGRAYSDTRFFPPGDIVQTPVLLEYDEKFDSKKGENPFFMHSSAAPKPRDYDDLEAYLQAMEEGYYHLLEQQVLSGAEHILTNYWGMGAFLRGYYSTRERMFDLRIKIAERLATAYRRIRDAYPEYTFIFYIGGPTGESFEEWAKAEPCDNYNAFIFAFGQLPEKYKKQIVMCPETDIFVKGQQLSDDYELSRGELAPVSAVNASDPLLFGNKWFIGKKKRGKFNAEFAIEENLFRRSPFACYIAEKVNAYKKCEDGISKLKS